MNMITMRNMLGEVFESLLSSNEQLLILVGLKNFNPINDLDGDEKYEFAL